MSLTELTWIPLFFSTVPQESGKERIADGFLGHPYLLCSSIRSFLITVVSIHEKKTRAQYLIKLECTFINRRNMENK